MRLRNRIPAILAVGVLFVSVALAGDDKAVERLFYNGKIFTGDPEHLYAQAVMIRGDKIVAVGNSTDIARTAERDAERVDLHGRTLLPGLIDSHVHATYGGLTLNSADVGDSVHTIAELTTFVAEAKKSGKATRGDILMVSGIPLAIWSKTKELNAQFSAGVYENQPLFLHGMDGHTCWANRALRLRAGVTKDFVSHLSDADRKYYGVGSDMEPNGFAVDKGLEKIEAVMPKPSPEELLEAGRSAVLLTQFRHNLLARSGRRRAHSDRLSLAVGARRANRARRGPAGGRAQEKRQHRSVD
ncbi:MAG: amidohydrolase family protein [Candidatus Acidiferrales bacterium]